MQFITSGDRIATENFTLGRIYTVTFNNGNYFVNTCIGIGPDYVMFQQEAPKMLFRLDMQTAANVDTIDESGGGAGTMNYNELENKPQINGVTLQGNKTLADLGIASLEDLAGKQDVISDLDTIRSGAAAGATAVQPAALDAYQPLINDLDTIRSGAAAGATAVQPATLSGYQTLIDSSHKLSSDLVDDTGHTNKFATAAQLTQIETNKTNISLSNSALIAYVVSLNGGVNLASSASGSGTRWVTISLPKTYPAGTYVVGFATLTSESNVSGIVQVNLMNGETNVGNPSYNSITLTDNPPIVTINATGSFDRIRLYADDNSESSINKVVSYTTAFLCPKTVWDVYPTIQ